MCLLIAEIMFLVMGLYAMIKGELPSWFVGKGYYAEGNQVRVLGILMAIPLPLAFCAGIVIGIIDQDLIWVGSSVELVSMLVVSLIAVFTLRKIRKPVPLIQANQQPNQE